MRIIVLGAGRVGEAIARDLAAAGRFELTVADVSQVAVDRLGPVEGLMTVRADLELDGVIEGERVMRRYDLLDRYDSETGITSMARTTGYTCTAMVNAIADGLYSEPGLSPPEIVGRDQACFDFIFDYLAERGVRFEITEETLGVES